MPTPVKSWEFLTDMFGREEKIGIMAYGAKGQHHKPDIDPEQIVITRGQATAKEFTNRLKYLNVHGLNIVVGMNPLKDDSTTRSKDNVKLVRHLVVDIDTRKDELTGSVITGKQLLDAMLKDPSCPQPRYILNTSPGNYQAIWRVAGFAREDAETIQKALGAHYRCDRNISTDISRGVRLPGLHNKKYAETFQVSGILHSPVIYRPEAFTYLPRESAQEQAQPTQPSQLTHPALAASKPRPFDPPTRGGSSASSPAQYSISGADQSGSGKDWAHCQHEIGVGLRKQGVSQFESLLQAQRPYLESAAKERGKGNPRYYAEHTIKKLRKDWEPRLHEFAYQPDQRLAGATDGTAAAAPAAPAAARPNPMRADDAPALPTPGNVPATAPSYAPSEEQRLQDGLCILQDLRDRHTGAQIYSNMLEWKLKDQPGAEAYLTSMIVEQQLALRSQSLVPTAQLLLENETSELDAFRLLLKEQIPGEGVLLTAVHALAQAQEHSGAALYTPQTGSPATSQETADHAHRLATLAFIHGDTPNSIAQALTAKYHPNLSIHTPPNHITDLVQQAHTAQALAFTTQGREFIR